MSPALNGSTALQRFERSNASEIRNGIMFDFYPGLPYMVYSKQSQVVDNIRSGNAHTVNPRRPITLSARDLRPERENHLDSAEAYR